LLYFFHLHIYTLTANLASGNGPSGSKKEPTMTLVVSERINNAKVIRQA
jgi:hypothetical protein